MSAQKPRIVLDCMVFLQAAAREKSPARRCLRLAEEHKVQLFISRKIIAEVREVLSREKIRRRFDALTDESVAVFIERVCQAADFVRTAPDHFDYSKRDPKDEPYINLAIEVAADYLVSRDNDLLDLMDWNREAGREFQKRFRFLQIVTPEDFLSKMDKV
ncbi:MAG: putative toxin-antitoxin system toxin component, PIN family [Acidobacteria bacterium]|nr:putative toxin-antitoxin system toxin component, PIN family [Acidobacteriota bacterium]